METKTKVVVAVVIVAALAAAAVVAANRDVIVDYAEDAVDGAELQVKKTKKKVK
jgi:hypothetical protein